MFYNCFLQIFLQNIPRQEIMYLCEDVDVKEILEDKELANMLKVTLLGYQILYQTK
jgi:hypothetical protein